MNFSSLTCAFQISILPSPVKDLIKIKSFQRCGVYFTMWKVIFVCFQGILVVEVHSYLSYISLPAAPYFASH